MKEIFGIYEAGPDSLVKACLTREIAESWKEGCQS